MNPEKDLITLCQQHGIIITEEDVPEILALGVDTFLNRRGVDLPVKYLDAFYFDFRHPQNSPKGRKN